MNVYKLLKWYRKIDSPRINMLTALTLHVLRRRYIYIAIDPSLACNLRCRMCYFSDPARHITPNKTFSAEDIEAIARATFHRALKIQIGCGGEPTTYKMLPQLVGLAKQYGIPNISISTNGNLLTTERLRELAEQGLTEIILSTHGLEKEVYEYMMPGARFERFTGLLKSISDIRKDFPGLRLRINFTINSGNISTLQHIGKVFADTRPNVLQLRPVQNIGGTGWDDYSMDTLKESYNQYVGPAVSFCQENGITCIYPKADNLESIEQEEEQMTHKSLSTDMLFYFHLSPHDGWRKEFDPYTETFESYCRRTHRVKNILRSIFGCRKEQYLESVTQALNYDLK